MPRGAMNSGATRTGPPAQRIVESGIPYGAFGGGEPLGVAYCWDLFEVLTAGSVALKLSRPMAAASTMPPPTAWPNSPSNACRFPSTARPR